ncbi:MAG: uracil-DNA glycosylase [Hydrogenoanaerobacterium sp.]
MTDSLEILYNEVLHCRACGLCEGRKTVVLGNGAANAKILLLGEAPGEAEDKSGEPFVGRSGKLLCELLTQAGFSREQDIYIANMLKCRPPKNRNPKPCELAACNGFLQRQIKLLAPKIIVCLGRVSAQSIIDKGFKVTVQHGQWVQKDGVWLMGTFHPASQLRSPSQKPLAMCDFAALRTKHDEIFA